MGITTRTNYRFFHPTLSGQYIATTAILSCSLSCGVLGPYFTCPESLQVGEATALSASEDDDAVIWTIAAGAQSGAVFILEDGTESSTATTGLMGGGSLFPGTTEIGFRAESSGKLSVRVE